MELDRGRPRSWAVQLEWYDPEEEREAYRAAKAQGKEAW